MGSLQLERSSRETTSWGFTWAKKKIEFYISICKENEKSLCAKEEKTTNNMVVPKEVN